MDEQTVARYWDENTTSWTEGVRAGHDIYREHVNNPAFFKMLPDLTEKTVLDVGCGEGYNTRLFADLGAIVTGVDISSNMIEAAREHEQQHNRGTNYIVTSGTDLSMFGDASFDMVLSTMALMDMPNYTGCIREISRVIKPNGYFQFSIVHPCSMTRSWKWLGDETNPKQYMRISNYFSLMKPEKEDEISEWYFSGIDAEIRNKATKFRVPDFYRTLSEYFNALVNSGFIVNKLVEPFADENSAKHFPGIAETRNIPYFLVFQCNKAG
ncbi:MAG: class I SAM-dependent methyltransferase [Planctomycetota bacterium]